MRKQQSTHSFASAMFRKIGRRLLLAAACAMLSIVAGAQTYPSFSAGGKTDLRTDESPSVVPLYLPHTPGTVFTWKSAMAYRDSRTGNVSVSLSMDGVAWSSPVDTGVPTDDPIAATDIFETGSTYLLYILVYTGGSYQYITSADGVTFTPPQPVALSIGGRTLRPHFKPSLTGYDTALYLSVVDTTPGSPNAVDVLVSNDNGQSFSSIQWLADIPTRSGSSLTVISLPGSRYEALALAYTTAENHPVLRTWLDWNNNEGYPDSFDSNTDTAVQMAGTPQLTEFVSPGSNNDLDLYIFGRSVGEADHLMAVDWAWPPNQQLSLFEPPQHYTRGFRHSPAVGTTNAGQLLIAFQSKGGNRIQTYTAPPAQPRQ